MHDKTLLPFLRVCVLKPYLRQHLKKQNKTGHFEIGIESALDFDLIAWFV
jgi:hypothetical protein